ncbi:hypothetical protein C2S53_004143 [Perilla frutescens var. hirtella]|uniref:Disease resistance protein At4g27190-like leucine-rich repeats domain-containing protein n=1 Tax=Perilla frutescens var. hirtella TaxID=608512 RepID=A0AAD4JLS1_PERFH|nr:hypothetical protein C2S51_036155 [Perilla frutescens var. frutescens]KAH6836152.1 hypothetical protein C2S53_004143 [Perilla frutescens var. hirtella]
MTSMVSSNENKWGGSSNADIDDGHSLHLFCQVSFGNLKELQTSHNPFSCGHIIDASLFIGLEKLTIDGYEGGMSLFSPSIVANLVSLRALSIHNCDDLVEVIKDDEEEKAASGGQKTTLLFPKLQELELYRLPKLVSFCEWKCNVELPSLRQVEIEECPNMKYFTLGFLAAPNLEAFKTDLNNFLEKLELENLRKLVSFCEWEFDVEFPSLREVDIYKCPDMKHFTLGLLTTPKLEVVRINREEIGGLKDLNGAVQQQFEKKQQEEKEGGAEVQETEEEELNS